jgi:NADH-quinone oxidoreductase subunit C
VLPETLLEYPDAVAVQDAVVTGKFAFGELTLEIDPTRIVEICARLKSARQFVRMSDLTAVDRYPEEPRFEIIYHLHSLARNARLRLKCRVSGTAPEIDSVTPVWRGANWFEREVFDLFGVRFRNHPDLRRIMLPDDYEGHPLRKDYPVTGTRV